MFKSLRQHAGIVILVTIFTFGITLHACTHPTTPNRQVFDTFLEGTTNEGRKFVCAVLAGSAMQMVEIRDAGSATLEQMANTFSAGVEDTNAKEVFLEMARFVFSNKLTGEENHAKVLEACLPKE